ncbi:nacht and ankyrin domain containing [Trichoderma arundinaceum]|uniref:Nacht and ankyrin domain containing n=1 Tax=Trichoderma arundinaceum TaxID=490622 RepID=A0A395NNC5_TRIAR|nr:nacht and ankyrin domain containing [Trichoderma arundinaceum]
MYFEWLRPWFKPSQSSNQHSLKGAWTFRVHGVPQDWDQAKLKAVHEALSPVSGLGGHAFGSFKNRHGEHMWLRDALQNNITEGDSKPIARVMVYGYDSSLPQSNSFQNLEDLGPAFHSHLRRLAATFQPIIFIAHSLGGLIVKQVCAHNIRLNSSLTVRRVLIYLSKSKDEDDQKPMRSVYRIVFFGVPHSGMDIQSLISMVGDGPNRFLLESLGSTNSQVLSTQQREFLLALGGQGQSEIVCCYETLMSPTAKKDENGKWAMTGPAAILVSKLSATHCRPWEDGAQYICPINRTHSEILKFGPEDHEYENALGRIEGLVRRALTSRRRSPRPNFSQEAQECLRSLAFEQMENRAHDVERPITGTCEWLLQHQTYTSWATSNRGMLWIKGKLGAGKSTLLKYAFSNQQQASSARDSDLVLSFFFHGRGDELQKTPLGFFRSLLHQVLKQVPEALSDLVASFEQKCK